MSSTIYGNPMAQSMESNYLMNLSPPPPPPPPRKTNCGELRNHHDGVTVEMSGKVNRTRMGRFIELKDQYGVIQLVAPIDVRKSQYSLYNYYKHNE